MDFVPHRTNNMILAAGDIPNCTDLPATCLIEDGEFQYIASFWKPTAEELKKLNDGEVVTLFIFSGTHPPVAIGVNPQ